VCGGCGNLNPLFPPDVPGVAHGGAAVVLALHIVCGCVGLASGTVAMAARKGGWLHRASGKVFFVSMMTMGAVGVSMVPVLPKWSSVVPGLFATYLVATGWSTAHRAPGPAGRFECGGMVAALCISVLAIALGLYASNSPTGRLSGAAPAYFYGVAALPLLSALGDLRLLRKRELRGVARLRRHIWRMSVGMFVAAVSFLPARSQAFPQPLRGSPILWAGPFAVLVFMAYWWIRVRLMKPLSSGAFPPAARPSPPQR
jgi:hypothetical protein